MGTSSAPPNNASEKVLSWDFRDGVLPTGIEIVGAGADPQFLGQRDGSTALLLPANSYLKVRKQNLILLM